MTNAILEDMLKEKIVGALARGYCSEKNKDKILDPDLIEAMSDEMLLILA